MAHKIKQLCKKDGTFAAPKLNLLHILVALAPKDQMTSPRIAQLLETPHAQGGHRKCWSCRDVQRHWERPDFALTMDWWSLLYNAVLRSGADPLCFHRMWFYMSDQLFTACFGYPLKWCTQCCLVHMAGAMWHCCCLGTFCAHRTTRLHWQFEGWGG